MSLFRVRYSIMTLCLMGGLFAVQAQRCIGGITAWPDPAFGASVGAALCLAPAFLYQRVLAALPLSFIGGLSGFVAGMCGRSLATQLHSFAPPLIAFMLSWLLLGLLLGGSAAITPAGIHSNRLWRGVQGGLLGGLSVGIVAALFPVTNSPILPLVRAGLAGGVFGACVAFALWHSRYWLVCLDASEDMPGAFPVYEGGPTLVGSSFDPAHFCIPHDPQVEKKHVRIVPLFEAREGAHRFIVYPTAAPAPLQIDGTTLAGGGTLNLGSRLVIGQTHLIFLSHPNPKNSSSHSAGETT